MEIGLSLLGLFVEEPGAHFDSDVSVIRLPCILWRLLVLDFGRNFGKGDLCGVLVNSDVRI